MAVKSVHLEPGYLLPESLKFVVDLFKTYPILSSLAVLGTFGVTLAVFRKMFGRVGYDTVVFSILVSAITIWVALSLYLLTHVEGFRFH